MHGTLAAGGALSQRSFTSQWAIAVGSSEDAVGCADATLLAAGPACGREVLDKVRSELEQADVLYVMAATGHDTVVTPRGIDHPVHDLFSGLPRQKWQPLPEGTARTADASRTEHESSSVPGTLAMAAPACLTVLRVRGQSFGRGSCGCSGEGRSGVPQSGLRHGPGRRTGTHTPRVLCRRTTVPSVCPQTGQTCLSSSIPPD